MAKAALFVSKRLQVLTATLLCLMAAQLTLANCAAEPAPYGMAARVTVAR